MIRPLRARHLWTFAALGFVLPVIFVGGLAARHSYLESTALATGPSPQVQRSGEGFSIGFDLQHPEGKRRIRFSAATYALAPDVLVYWSQAGTEDVNSARLLGPLRAGSVHDLPGPGGGALIFYSLGYRKTLATVPLGGQP